VSDVTSTATSTGTHTTIELHRDGELTLPAKVRVLTDDGPRALAWDTRARDAELELDTDAPPTAVVIDPDKWIPDPDRANNVWPAKERFEWLAPHRNPDATTIAFNPLPLHRQYLAGASVGGVDFEGNTLWTGVGVSGIGMVTRDTPTAADPKATTTDTYSVQSVVYGELAMPTGRGDQLSATVRGGYNRDWDNGDYVTGRASVAYTLSIYQPTDLGLTGTWTLPRTTLTAEAGVGGVSIRDGASEWSDQHLTDPTVVREGAVPLLSLTLRRDESLNYGVAGELKLAGGTNQSLKKGYGVTEADVAYGVVVPYLGHLDLLAHGFVGTPNVDALFGRPDVLSLPATTRRGINPYDIAMDGGAVLTVPILRDLRIKNELTLGLLVFNDLSLELHYGLARGTTWTTRGADHIRPYEDLGEAGAGLGLGFGFLGTPLNFAVGVGAPVWPASADFSKRGLFVRLGT